MYSQCVLCILRTKAEHISLLVPMVLDIMVFYFRIETGRISPLFLIVLDITACSVFTMYFMCFQD